jgi:pyrroloquinoline-quinone synthase
VSLDNLDENSEDTATLNLVQGYFDLVDEGYPAALGALYAYERQTPAVSESKIKGLKQFYGIEEEAALAFFAVHAQADVWHSAEFAQLIVDLAPEDQQKAHIAAEKGAKLLWQFLDGRMSNRTTH